MNLINDPWIPIQRTDGTHELIAPWQLTETDNPVLALDAPRPDFNGALMQFLIGLLQTAATPENHDHWLDWLEEPPTSDELKERFARYESAFDLSGEQGSFMQDFEELERGVVNNINGFLIDSPGDKTVDDNTDHFVKRSRVQQLCSSCTATALFTLQINAPSGGAGHMTSMRGGGPLTTLVVLDENSDLPSDLWRNTWINVLDALFVKTMTGDFDKDEKKYIFPWLEKTRTSERNGGQSTTPLDMHPFHMYWSMPRRIKLSLDSCKKGVCNLCNQETESLISEYTAKTYGFDYKGAWKHPLSPTYIKKEKIKDQKNKKKSVQRLLLTQHPQAGGFNYSHWLNFSDCHDRFSADVVRRYHKYLTDMNATSSESEQEHVRLYAFGYDMDNMKARCWYETTFPLISIEKGIRLDFSKRVKVMTDVASDIAESIRSRVKEAWFKRPGEIKGETSFIVKSFFQHTESIFFSEVRLLERNLIDGTDREVLQKWHKILSKSAEEIFDYWASKSDISYANPRRIAKARNDLMQKDLYKRKIKNSLQLPDTYKSSSKKEVT